MLSWNVLLEDINKKEIVTYNIFKGGHYEKIAKEIKTTVKTKEEFAEGFRIKLMSQFWCRSEYEIVVTSWPPYINKEELDRLTAEPEDAQYKTYIKLAVGKKLDIYEQLRMNWTSFIDYVWNNI